jgi:hypothetical protein
MEFSAPITIALAKGRILRDTLPLPASAFRKRYSPRPQAGQSGLRPAMPNCSKLLSHRSIIIIPRLISPRPDSSFIASAALMEAIRVTMGA